MPFNHNETIQVVRIPLRQIEQQFGRDAHDEAGDDVLKCLREVGGVDLRTTFEFNTVHTNPWYHTLDFGVQGLSETQYDSLVERLAACGLMDERFRNQ